jgi:CRP/FNR family cyclic AMP-dependent transcriptional regulator
MNPPTRCCADFSGLIREHLQRLEQSGSRRRYERNEVIYSPTDAADTVYVVESGRVKVQLGTPDGKEKTLSLCLPGDVFGELCICGIVQRSDQAVALEPATVALFGVEGLLKLFARETELARSFFQLVCGRVLECQDQLAALAFEHTPRRLARELLRLSELPDSSPENGAVRLGANLTHEELATLIGTSRGVVTTLMNEFRTRGLVDYRPRAICVFAERVKAYLDESRL